MSQRQLLSLVRGQARCLSSSARRCMPDSTAAAAQAQQPPAPPKPIDDSTSALDYKMQRTGSKRLPHLVRQRHVSAEEAVTNILYNTPPPSTEPYKRHRLNCLVQNEPGVLSRVSGILAGRGFNIDSLVVCQTEIRDLSRMCIVLKGQDGVIEQARRQLEDLVPVWAVLDYTHTNCVERELLLAKVSILGPEYNNTEHYPTELEHHVADHAAAPAFVPSDSAEAEKVQREQAMVRSFEGAASGVNQLYPNRKDHATAADALIAKNLHFSAIKNLAMHFGGKVVDMGEDNCIVELVAKSRRIDAFLSLMRPFGVLEAARSGVMVLPRTPIPKYGEEEEVAEVAEAIDMSMLPPG